MGGAGGGKSWTATRGTCSAPGAIPPRDPSGGSNPFRRAGMTDAGRAAPAGVGFLLPGAPPAAAPNPGLIPAVPAAGRPFPAVAAGGAFAAPALAAVAGFAPPGFPVAPLDFVPAGGIGGAAIAVAPRVNNTSAGAARSAARWLDIA